MNGIVSECRGGIRCGQKSHLALLFRTYKQLYSTILWPNFVLSFVSSKSNEVKNSHKQLQATWPVACSTSACIFKISQNRIYRHALYHYNVSSKKTSSNYSKWVPILRWPAFNQNSTFWNLTTTRFALYCSGSYKMTNHFFFSVRPIFSVF